MMPSYLPEPLPRFRAIYEALYNEQGWGGGETNSLRFAAIAAVSCPGEPTEVASKIKTVADEIKTKVGWFGDLRSSLRFIVSVMLIMNEDNVLDFLEETKRVHAMFRAAKLRNGGIYETMAILIMRLSFFRAPIQMETLERFKTIYEQMKKYHWWLTGPDDFPACAILVIQKESPEQIGLTIEKIYQELKIREFVPGDYLQTAANILYLTHTEPVEITERYSNLATAFRRAGVQMWQSDYDELAILSFLESPPDFIVEKLLDYREKVKTLHPKPDSTLTFNLAASITFLELIRLNKKLKTIADVKALLDMQAIINAAAAAAAAAS
ncbi:MAG: hypothetical protein FD167_1203 [bacterium]|nr:MAG: hypothetical protein FD167_1203 [bacterium]